MKLVDYTLFVARLSACVPDQSGANCIRQACGCNSREFLQLLYQTLTREEYEKMVEKIRTIRQEKKAGSIDYPGKFPMYRQEMIIGSCLKFTELLQALSEVVKID